MNPNSVIQTTQSTSGETFNPPTFLRNDVASAPSPALKDFSGTAFTFRATTSNSESKSPGCVAEPSAPVSAPVSSCSAALSNEDILGQIFQEVDASFCGGDLKKRNQALLWAAQTSKTFFRPAVNVLWRVIRSLVPLLKILPQFKTSKPVHTLVGQISDNDWSRFEMYARSVRILDLSLPSGAVATDVYVQLARLHPDSLLPGLQRMNIPTIADGSTDFLAPLFHCITSTLSSVNIGIINGPKAELLTTSFLSALARDAGLRDLSIDARVRSEAIDILMNIPSVRNLKLSISSPTFQSNFSKLLNLPGLSSATVNFSHAGSLVGSPPAIFGQLQSCNRLKAIRVAGNGDQIKQVFTILPMLLGGIEDVDVFFQGPPYPTAFYAWQGAPRTLRHLKLETGQPPMPSLLLRDLSPYSSNIVSLELKGFTLQATDADILKICKTGNWANLEILHLPCFEYPESVSILILSEISRWCPKLRSLYICVDVNRHDNDSMRKAILANIERQTSHKLERLEIHSVRPPKTTVFFLLAQYIDSVFPHINSLAAYGNGDGNYWDEIWHAVRCCQAWRAQLALTPNSVTTGETASH